MRTIAKSESQRQAPSKRRAAYLSGGGAFIVCRRRTGLSIIGKLMLSMHYRRRRPRCCIRQSIFLPHPHKWSFDDVKGPPGQEKVVTQHHECGKKTKVIEPLRIGEVKASQADILPGRSPAPAATGRRAERIFSSSP